MFNRFQDDFHIILSIPDTKAQALQNKNPHSMHMKSVQRAMPLKSIVFRNTKERSMTSHLEHRG